MELQFPIGSILRREMNGIINPRSSAINFSINSLFFKRGSVNFSAASLKICCLPTESEFGHNNGMNFESLKLFYKRNFNQEPIFTLS